GGRGISATNVAKTLSDVSITNSLFKDLTKNGIKVSSFSEDVDVSSNIFDTIGTATSDEGVAIQFFHTTVGGDYSQTSRITVTNNKISNVDAVSGGEAHGIFMRGSYITISDNHIDGVGAGTNHEGIYTKAHQSEVSHNTVTSVGTSATCIMMKGGFAQDNIVESNICTPIDGGAGISINVGCTVSDNTVIGAAIIIAASDEGNPRYTYVVNDNYVESTGICLGVRDAIAANITGNLLISTGDDCITFSNNESASPHFGYALQDTVISGNTLITTGSNKRGIDGSAKILNTTITGNNITSTGFPISFTVTGSTASVHGNTWNGSAIAVIPAGQTTPNVSEWGTNVFQTANVGAVSITRLDTGFGGKPFTVIGTDGGNTTFVDTANSIALAGGANLTLGDSDTLNLVFLSYQGVHDGGDDAALLTDGGAVFPVDGFIGKIVVNMTDKSSVTITDNDGTTVTGTLAGGADNDWDDDDIYIIGYQWVEVSRSNN
ncbi:hypothetical protein KAR91_66660, partial [Candidatus Pacearchaeota archaeon]|nr:hypothetical protein [Candidatus Pacearchaeota archaeon]